MKKVIALVLVLCISIAMGTALADKEIQFKDCVVLLPETYEIDNSVGFSDRVRYDDKANNRAILICGRDMGGLNLPLETLLSLVAREADGKVTTSATTVQKYNPKGKKIEYSYGVFDMQEGAEYKKSVIIMYNSDVYMIVFVWKSILGSDFDTVMDSLTFV